MRKRCNSVTSSGYAQYGGRGIAICAEWDDYAVFRSWAHANGYQDNLSIERIDNDGSYEPANCRWANKKSQARNRRSTAWVEWRGERLSLAEWADRTGIKVATLAFRLKKGWDVERAMSSPLLGTGPGKKC